MGVPVPSSTTLVCGGRAVCSCWTDSWPLASVHGSKVDAETNKSSLSLTGSLHWLRWNEEPNIAQHFFSLVADPEDDNQGVLDISTVASCRIFANRSSSPMKLCCHILCVLLLSFSAAGQSQQSKAPQVAEFASGKLRLNGYLWKPAGTGPFPAVLRSSETRIFVREFVVTRPRTRCSVDVLFHAANTRGVTFFLCFLRTDGSQSCFVVNEWAAGNMKGFAVI